MGLTQIVEGRYNVRSIPATVQTKRAAIRFFATAISDIPADFGWIRIAIPDNIKAYKLARGDANSGTDPIYCEDKQADPPAECTVKYKEVNNSKTFEIVSTRYISTGDQFDFVIWNAIDNPMSRAPTGAFPITTDSGSTYSDPDIFAIQATAGEIRDISFTPGSQIVGASESLEVKFTPSNTIPVGASLRLEFPKWNINAKPEDQKSFI